MTTELNPCTSVNDPDLFRPASESGITRRSFLKRTASTVLLTALAVNLFAVEQNSESLPSSSETTKFILKLTTWPGNLFEKKSEVPIGMWPKITLTQKLVSEVPLEPEVVSQMSDTDPLNPDLLTLPWPMEGGYEGEKEAYHLAPAVLYTSALGDFDKVEAPLPLRPYAPGVFVNGIFVEPDNRGYWAKKLDFKFSEGKLLLDLDTNFITIPPGVADSSVSVNEDTGVTTEAVPNPLMVAMGEKLIKVHHNGIIMDMWAPYKVWVIPFIGGFNIRIDWYTPRLDPNMPIQNGENVDRWQVVPGPIFQYEKKNYKAPL